METASHTRPSWLDMQPEAFVGVQRYAVMDSTETRPPSATCAQCGALQPDPELGRAAALRIAARAHTSETGHAVTLSSGEKVTVFEVPPAGGVVDPMGTPDMFADLS